MCDNYLLCFLGLRTCTKQQSEDMVLPWTHSKKYFNRINFSNNYINKNDIIRCIDSHKNNYSLNCIINQNLNNFHTTSSPNIHISNSPNINLSNLSNIELDSSSNIHISNSPSFNIQNSNIKDQINRNYMHYSSKHERVKSNSYISILSWIYSIFILLILLLPTIWYVLKYNNLSSYYLPYILFYGIYPTQYILSIIYYSNDHYDRLLHLWDKTFIKNDYISITKKEFSIYCILLFVVIISSINLYYLINGDYKSEYFDYINNNYIYFVIFLEWIYGRTLILFNLFVFFFTFHTHIYDMKNNVDFLEQSNWVFYKDTKKISDICTDIIIKKFELEESIQFLQNIFSSSTILGTIGFVITILNYKEYGCDLYLLILCIIYIVIQFYFFIIIITISNQQTSMKQSIRHPIFASHWIQRIKIDKRRLSQNDIQSISIEENGTSIDWVILNTILNDKWVQFEFFGIPLNDAELIKRCCGFAGLILGINKISLDYFAKM